MCGFAEEVYESLCGDLVEPVCGVEDAFAEGSNCEQWYLDMLNAYERLRERLGAVNSDPDAEIMIDSLLCIQRELCLKMYEYGVRFGRK